MRDKSEARESLKPSKWRLKMIINKNRNIKFPYKSQPKIRIQSTIIWVYKVRYSTL